MILKNIFEQKSVDQIVQLMNEAVSEVESQQMTMSEEEIIEYDAEYGYFDEED